MKTDARFLRALALPVVALVAVACGSGNELPELDPDQAMIYVENDINDAMYVTVAVEDSNGRTVTLGNVRRGDAVNFPVLAADWDHTIRLIAVSPGDDDRDDHVISESFTVHGGYKVNWFLPNNQLEVSEDDTAN